MSGLTFPQFGVIDGPQFDYVVPSDPSPTIKPKRPYASWVNSISGEQFICIGWEPGFSRWVGQNAFNVKPVYPVIFNGTSSVINAGQIFDFSGSQPFTLELMAKTTELGTDNYILGSDLNTGMYIRFQSDGTFLAKVDDGTNDAYTNGSTVINDGVGRRLSVVFDGSTLTAYINGVVEFSIDAVGIGQMNDDFYIGAVALDGGLSTRYFSGSLWDVRIWDIALTEKQVKACLSIDPRVLKNHENLKVYYPCHSNSTAILYDAISGQDATMTACTRAAEV